MKRNILITGGAGFIGSHVVRLFVGKYPDCRIVNLDRLTYAGNLANLRDVENRPNYTFVKGDICDYDAMRSLFAEYDIDGVIHLAAESHVDRSIRDPFTFARTNVMGTLTLLQAAREHWNGAWEGRRFHHISTDEVYGALPFDGTLFTEQTRYDPHSPDSASKASSDHFVRAFHDTYGFPAVVTNCSNNYGPYQFPEKLIPLFINNIRHEKPLPVYGRGENVRDWLYVEDHARAIDTIFHRGRDGETYNIGGFNEWRNIDLIRVIIRTVDRLLGRPDHLRHRPGRARPALRHRLAQTQGGAGLGAFAAIRGGHREDRAVVPRQPGVDGRHHLGGIRAVLSGNVYRAVDAYFRIVSRSGAYVLFDRKKYQKLSDRCLRLLWAA